MQLVIGSAGVSQQFWVLARGGMFAPPPPWLQLDLGGAGDTEQFSVQARGGWQNAKYLPPPSWLLLDLGGAGDTQQYAHYMLTCHIIPWLPSRDIRSYSWKLATQWPVIDCILSLQSSQFSWWQTIRLPRFCYCSV